MLKRVGIFSLPEGTDPDEFWNSWVHTHAPKFKKVPGLRKYTLNRVTTVVKGDGKLKGDVKFYGLAELWFDSEEAHDQAHNTPEAKLANEEWRQWGDGPGSFSVFMEEIEIL